MHQIQYRNTNSVAHQASDPVAAAIAAAQYRALVLTPHNGVASLDKATLRQCGIRTVETFGSGIRTAKWLDLQATRLHTENNHIPPADLILCDEVLDDISGLEFAAIMAKHPLLSSIPIIFMASSATRETVVKVLQTGCCGFLLRPYTVDSFATQIKRARGIMQRTRQAGALMNKAETTLCKEAFDEALAAFASVITRNSSPDEELFAKGMEHLSHSDYDSALEAFGNAVRINALHADAYSGMARCWKAKGNMPNYHKCLKLSGEAHLRQERFREARNVFAKLMEVAGSATNPMLQSAANLVRQGNLHAAAGAFLHGTTLTPEVRLHECIARACQFTESPERTMEQICDAVETIAGPARAHPLRKRLLDTGPVVQEPPAQASTFPKLEEIIAVAKYTIKLYRQRAA
ncbi:response regulator [Oleidesulfovibrio sp.]|uniref:response regulator n=1 Tax=Oleidesulfovibrio sp. TaxID=2909707 RepID=UPI003A83E97C